MSSDHPVRLISVFTLTDPELRLRSFVKYLYRFCYEAEFLKAKMDQIRCFTGRGVLLSLFRHLAPYVGPEITYSYPDNIRYVVFREIATRKRPNLHPPCTSKKTWDWGILCCKQGCCSGYRRLWVWIQGWSEPLNHSFVQVKHIYATLKLSSVTKQQQNMASVILCHVWKMESLQCHPAARLQARGALWQRHEVTVSLWMWQNRAWADASMVVLWNITGEGRSDEGVNKCNYNSSSLCILLYNGATVAHVLACVSTLPNSGIVFPLCCFDELFWSCCR